MTPGPRSYPDGRIDTPSEDELPREFDPDEWALEAATDATLPSGRFPVLDDEDEG